MSTLVGIAFLTLGAASALAPPAAAGDTSMLEPGDRLEFTEPDTDPTFVAELFYGATCASLPAAPGGFSGSYLSGLLPLARANCELAQYNDFIVSPGPIGEAVVMAHVSGEVAANGFLLLIGLGQIGASLEVQLIDRGEDLLSDEDDKVVATRTIAAHEIVNELNPGVEFGGEVAAGSITAIIAGLEAAVGFDIPICLKVIRDAVPFDLDVPLRRGHSYRLQAVGTSSLRLGLAGGIAKAAFHSDFNLPENVFSPVCWLQSTSLPIKNWGLPAIPLPFSSAFTFPALEIPFDPDPLVIIPETSIPMLVPFATSNDLLMAIGLPTTLQELLDHPWVNLDVDLGPEESILNAGVRFESLAVSAEHDVLEENLLHRIEENLARRDVNEALYQYQLPAAHEGYLEIGRGIAQDAVDAMLAAGQDVHNAGKSLVLGDEALAESDYKVAYKYYRRAYRQATQR